MAVGSVQKNLYTSVLGSLEINLPPLPTQRLIAAILSSLDDKIENNRKTCEKLEEIAQAIFKRWFVEFEFPNEDGLPYKSSDGERGVCEELGKEIPKGWECVKLTDIADIIGGGTPKTTVEEYWNGDIPWYSVVDAPNNGQAFVVDTEKHITERGLSESSTKLLPNGATIISARGTVGKCAITAVPMTMNQSCYGIKSKVDATNVLVYLFVLEMVDILKQSSHGSVFNTITRATIDLKGFPYSEAFAKRISEIIEPVFERMRAIQFENRELQQTREALLPKLMSGELAVDDVEV